MIDLQERQKKFAYGARRLADIDAKFSCSGSTDACNSSIDLLLYLSCQSSNKKKR